MNEHLDTEPAPVNPAPEPTPTSKGQRRATTFGWGVAGLVLPVAAALGAGWLYLESLPDTADWDGLLVLFIVPAVYIIVLAMLGLAGFVRGRQSGDGASRVGAVLLVPVGAVVAMVIGNGIANVDWDDIVPSSESRSVDGALNDLTSFGNDIPWRAPSSTEPALANCNTELTQRRRTIRTTGETANVLLDDLAAEISSLGDAQLYHLVDVDNGSIRLHAVVKSEGVLLQLNAAFDDPTGSISLIGTVSDCVATLDPVPDGAILGWPENRFESTPESVDLDELLAMAELPDSRRMLYAVNGPEGQWAGCPDGTARASSLSGGDADIDGWIDEQAEILEEAGFETRTVSYIKTSEYRPDSPARRLLAVNGSAALIFEAEQRETFEIALQAIIVGSCVEDAGLALIDMDPSLEGVNLLEDSGVS